MLAILDPENLLLRRFHHPLVPCGVVSNRVSAACFFEARVCFLSVAGADIIVPVFKCEAFVIDMEYERRHHHLKKRADEIAAMTCDVNADLNAMSEAHSALADDIQATGMGEHENSPLMQEFIHNHRSIIARNLIQSLAERVELLEARIGGSSTKQALAPTPQQHSTVDAELNELEESVPHLAETAQAAQAPTRRSIPLSAPRPSRF